MGKKKSATVAALSASDEGSRLDGLGDRTVDVFGCDGQLDHRVLDVAVAQTLLDHLDRDCAWCEWRGDAWTGVVITDNRLRVGYGASRSPPASLCEALRAGSGEDAEAVVRADCAQGCAYAPRQSSRRPLFQTSFLQERRLPCGLHTNT